MSENAENVICSVDDYIEKADEIRIANRIQGREMDEMFDTLAAKAKGYRDQCRTLETRVESMKNTILKQWQQINYLKDKLDEKTRKLAIAESLAQESAAKYNRMFGKLRDLVLESAAEWTADGERN